MSMFDKLLGFDLVEDLTETTWWTETIFRGLEKRSNKQAIDLEVAAASTQTRSELE